MHELVTPEMGDAPFGDFADLVRDGEIIYGSYWEHLRRGWSRRGHPNMKFIWFEDLKGSCRYDVHLGAFTNDVSMGVLATFRFLYVLRVYTLFHLPMWTSYKYPILP